jgi:hypothetical protein
MEVWILSVKPNKRRTLNLELRTLNCSGASKFNVRGSKFARPVPGPKARRPAPESGGPPG